MLWYAGIFIYSIFDDETGYKRMSSENPGNELAKAASAYLRSAAHQPVLWHEWNADAFGQAKSDRLPRRALGKGEFQRQSIALTEDFSLKYGLDAQQRRARGDHLPRRHRPRVSSRPRLYSPCREPLNRSRRGPLSRCSIRRFPCSGKSWNASFRRWKRCCGR